MGISAEGINREVSATVESATLCKYTTAKPLAIPETALYKLADLLVRVGTENSDNPSWTLEELHGASKGQYFPAGQDIVRGILPSLRHVVSRDTRSVVSSHPQTQKSILVEPDNSRDTLVHAFTIDPYGNDYYCKTCESEIANLYFQCNGCILRVGREFNICFDCYTKSKHLKNVFMTEVTVDNKLSLDHHHIVEGPFQCGTKCRKRNCQHLCHSKFTRHLRFYSDDCVSQMIPNCEALLDGNEVPYASETLLRLNGLLQQVDGHNTTGP